MSKPVLQAATMSEIPKAAPVPVTPAGPVLRGENVRRCFIDGDHRLEVLKDVNLALRPGDLSALVGRSGSGKSTLLHLLGLLDRVDDGEIFVDGTPVKGLGESELSYLRNRFIGFVFQHYFLLSEFSVLENVLMPCKVASSFMGWFGVEAKYRQRARDLINLVGLNAQINQRPNTLSGGERQRVSMARALMLEPRILLCDEPTGNLDPETAAHIMDLIFECTRKLGTAALVVTHDPTLASRAAQVWRLEKGVLNREK